MSDTNFSPDLDDFYPLVYLCKSRFMMIVTSIFFYMSEAQFTEAKHISFFPVVQCQTLNEEELFEVQDKYSLFQLGWIHVSYIVPC